LSGYDFSTLSPHDFEVLTCDLLQRHLGVTLEAFKSGRDKGTDLRYTCDKGRTVVIQCKHYHSSTYSTLKSHLKNKERPKLDRLKPGRYILVTSQALLPQQKDELVALFSPFCVGSSDVFGADDLNNLLRAHSDIERKHFKLWIASVPVLQAVLHHGLFARSYLEEKEIKRRISLFVTTPAMDRALETLQSHGYCLISGIPGIGKTTTAEMLVAMLIEKGWECVCISSNIADAFDAYQAAEQQIFYYDDFLGQTSLDEKLLKNEDHDLLRLIRACRDNSKTKRLILTTREYLLAQAMRQHEVLERSGINLAQCTIRLEDYTPRIRAEILVNHLFFYGVNQDCCRLLVESSDARKIVDHENYSPRVIEAMCMSAVREGHDHKDFGGKFLASLDNPDQIWRHAFDSQIGPDARSLLLCLATTGNNTELEHLKQAFLNYSGANQDALAFDIRFRQALKELEGTFVEIDIAGQQRIITFHNPSVKDFVDRLFATMPEIGAQVLSVAIYHSQVSMAARVLGPNHPKLRDLGPIVQSLRRTYRSEVPSVEKLTSRLYAKSTEHISARLSSWFDFLGVRKDTDCYAEICKLANVYLNAPDPDHDGVESVIELYSNADDMAFLSDTPFEVDLEQLKQWLSSNLKTLDDHAALAEFLEKHPGAGGPDNAIVQLREQFVKSVSTRIDEGCDSANSAQEIDEIIETILGAAGRIGVPADELEIGRAEKARDRKARDEDRYADSHQEEYGIQRYEERMEDSAVNDILDSLRDAG
jgi:hypothetical protein